MVEKVVVATRKVVSTLMNLAMMVLHIALEAMVVIIMIGEMVEDQEIPENIVVMIEKIANIPEKGNIEIVVVEEITLEATMKGTTETAETEASEEEEVQITIVKIQMIHEDQAHHTIRAETEGKREKEIEEALTTELRLSMTDRDLGAEIDDI